MEFECFLDEQIVIQNFNIDTIPQADWQQNNESAIDYIKNRPGGYDIITEILPETNLNFTNSNFLNFIDCPLPEVDKIYKITFDNIDYELVGKESKIDNTNYICIGNETYIGGSNDTGEPFLICSNRNSSTPYIYISSSEILPCTYNIKIKTFLPVKINEKYLDIKNIDVNKLTQTGGEALVLDGGNAKSN